MIDTLRRLSNSTVFWCVVGDGSLADGGILRSSFADDIIVDGCVLGGSNTGLLVDLLSNASGVFDLSTLSLNSNYASSILDSGLLVNGLSLESKGVDLGRIHSGACNLIDSLILNWFLSDLIESFNN